MDLFKKSIIVGVSVTPEVGLEVAQIDFATHTALKYGSKPLDYDVNKREIADLDLFKETLADLLFELQIPAGSRIVLNLPPVSYKINDYPAALETVQIQNAVEEEMRDLPYFADNYPSVDIASMRSASIQFKKVACAAVQQPQLIEIAQAIKDIGYKLHAIETSVNSVIKALTYKQRVDVAENKNWVLLIVDQMCCRVFNMSGSGFIDGYEEKVSIGAVLSDAENYTTVLQAVSPILKNMPAKYLCVVSETNVISAEVLANKIQYAAPIIYQEANVYSKEAFIDIGPEIDDSLATQISLNVIGAAIYEDYLPFTEANMNLYNESLGTIYTSEQPPILYLGAKKYSLTNELLVRIAITVFIILLIPTLFVYISLSNVLKTKRNTLGDIEKNIAQMQTFLKDNEKVSSDLFNEGDEIKLGLVRNKDIYSYIMIVGTEIPKKLWLTHLELGDKVIIAGQADNLESVYAFYRNIKDYVPNSGIKLQKLGLASMSKGLTDLAVITSNKDDEIDVDDVLTSLEADFYEFIISNDNSVAQKGDNKKSSVTKYGMQQKNKQNQPNVPELELIKD